MLNVEKIQKNHFLQNILYLKTNKFCYLFCILFIYKDIFELQIFFITLELSHAFCGRAFEFFIILDWLLIEKTSSGKYFTQSKLKQHIFSENLYLFQSYKRLIRQHASLWQEFEFNSNTDYQFKGPPLFFYTHTIVSISDGKSVNFDILLNTHPTNVINMLSIKT